MDRQSPLITKKILLIILDGVGIGELPDAGKYGDEGSNTLAHTASAVGGLRLPHLGVMGLGKIVPIQGVPPSQSPRASYGKMAEVSQGKDSTTGHWELAGLVTAKEFPTFPNGFPGGLMQKFVAATHCGGVLGNKVASGTAIIQELGAEHVRTGYPIVYTSADSVFQIAAHEDVISLDRLYEMCRTTRTEVCTGAWAVSRVIARPFVGAPGTYTRTANRRDFSLEPPASTLLDLLVRAGIPTVGVGKVDDLFAGRGVQACFHVRGNAHGIDVIIRESQKMKWGMVIANLGDFDTQFGHRNDPVGFARALEEFDREIPRILETLAPDDVLVITADHGNDPVTPSTDHSREYVPLLVYTPRRQEGVNLGVRTTFADVGRTIADFFSLGDGIAGTSFWPEICN